SLGNACQSAELRRRRIARCPVRGQCQSCHVASIALAEPRRDGFIRSGHGGSMRGHGALSRRRWNMNDDKSIPDSSDLTVQPRNLVLELLLGILLVTILAGISVALAWMYWQSQGRTGVRRVSQEIEPPASEGFGTVPDFSLVDQTGKSVTRA